MDIETRLRHDLAQRAGNISAAPTDLHDQVLDGHRTPRRHQMGLVALAVALAAIVALVPLTIGGDGRGQTATPSDTPSSAPTAPAGPVVPYQRYDLPPRGSLAGDAAYLQGLLDRPWSIVDPTTDPAPETRQVVFAGEVPGGVQALVVGEQDGGMVGLWLNGPTGASPSQLEASNESNPVDLGQPVSYTYTRDGVGALIVIGRPGDVIEVSRGQVIASDASVTRLPFEAVGDATGVAVVDASGLSPRTTAIRVTRDGAVIKVFGEGGSSGGTLIEPDLTDAFVGAAGAPDAGLVRNLLQMLPDELGMAAADLQVHVLWGGSIGIAQQPDAEAVVLTVRLPSGAVLLFGGRGEQRAGESDGGGFTFGGRCAQALLPIGTDPSASGVAMVCALYDPQGAGGELGRQLVVVPPAGTASLQAVDADGDELQSYDFFGDALVVPAPDGVTAVTARDAAGQVLGDIPLTGQQKLTAD